MKQYIIALLIFITPCYARDAKVVYQFQKTHICPATGKTGKCPGYVVDHIKPLCLGGPDSVINMQYQTKLDSYKKDVIERRACKAMKSANNQF